MAVLEFLEVSTEGLKNYFWPCRMETFLVDDVTVVLDGCHNDDSVKLFMEGLKQQYPGSSLLILFGAGMEKYLPDMLDHVFRTADSVLMVQSRHFKSLCEIDLISACSEAQRVLLQPLSDIKRSNTVRAPYNSSNLVTYPLPRNAAGTISERLHWAMEYARYLANTFFLIF
jgi:folylpolyglutamate synthase/dihydropteroate synthase